MDSTSTGTTHDRRRFIVGAAAATAAVAAGGIGGVRLLGESGRPGAVRTLGADELGHELLSSMAGDRLSLTGVAGAVTAKIASVSERVAYGNVDGVSGTSFSVVVESAEKIEQGVFEFAHETVGRFPMFVVPVDMPTGGLHTYEAVFNRLD